MEGYKNVNKYKVDPPNSNSMSETHKRLDKVFEKSTGDDLKDAE